MASLWNKLMGVIALATSAELRRQVQFLKAENEVLRRRVGQVRTTPAERARLVKLGLPLGDAVRSLVTIVTPATFMRWVNQAEKKPGKASARDPGRPRTPEAVRQLVLRLARETDWGFTRIRGECRKLGIRVSRATVMRILKEGRVPTSPQRREQSWDEFLRAHAQTLWACDYLSKRILTAKGYVKAFVLVFINIKTRRVIATPATTSPTAAWAAWQAEEFVAAAEKIGLAPSLLLRDGDAKFGVPFNAAIRQAGARVKILPRNSPNLNAFAERFVQTLQSECLDRFLVLGTGHLNHLVSEFVDYYNRQRPHSRLDGHRPPARTGLPEGEGLPDMRGIVCEPRLGGVIKHYYRSAA